MHSANVWELPFEDRAVLELQMDFGRLALLPVEAGQRPRLEISGNPNGDIEVHLEKLDKMVRVAIEPRSSFKWFGGGWDCRVVAYVPRDVRAALQTNAGAVSVRGLEGCELGIKADTGKIDLVDVYGVMHLGADAGSITGRGLGGAFDVQTHAGSIKMEILDLQPGEHRFRASMGSVRLELARGMDLCIETHTALGSVRNGYPVRADAPTRLDVATEMGSLRIDQASTARPSRAGERPAEDSRPAHADPELERILKMVEAGELSARDADELLRAMGRV